jgi:predicted MPP superfamily phosphohydrolase
MALILHLSDIHFGAHDPRLVAAAEARIDGEKADDVVRIGDFTQRAPT